MQNAHEKARQIWVLILASSERLEFFPFSPWGRTQYDKACKSLPPLRRENEQGRRPCSFLRNS